MVEAASDLSESLTTCSFTELQSDSANSFVDKTTDKQALEPGDQPVTINPATVEPQVESAANEIEQTAEYEGTEQNGAIILQTDESREVKVSDETSENADSTDSMSDLKRDGHSSDLAPGTPPFQSRTISPLALSFHDASGSSMPPKLSRTISPVTKDPARPSSLKNFSRAGQPSPIVSTPPTPLSLSRTSSAEPPQSPFLIPRNPFLSLVGKMPKFQWDIVHFSLLENLFKSLHAIVSKWTR